MKVNYPDQDKIILTGEYLNTAKAISSAVNKYNKIDNKYKKLKLPI